MCTHWGPGYLSPPESGLRLVQGPSRTRGLLLRPWSLHLMEVGGGEEGGQVILGPLIPTPSPSTPCCSEQRGAMSTWSTQSAELRLGGNSRLRSILPSPSEDGHGMERGPGLILPRPEPTRSRLCVPSPLPRAHLPRPPGGGWGGGTRLPAQPQTLRPPPPPPRSCSRHLLLLLGSWHQPGL